jgi:hypothetical protein
MAEIPSMDDIFKAGRARERRTEIFLGLLLVGGGLAWRFGMASLMGGGSVAYGYGAVGLGVVLLARGGFVGWKAGKGA